MLETFSQDYAALKSRADHIARFFHHETKVQHINQLEKLTIAPDFWNDQNEAQIVMGKLSALRDEVKLYTTLTRLLEEIDLSAELAELDVSEDVDDEVEALLSEANNIADALETSSWFDGQLDSGDAIVTIIPGQGGLKAQDWTDMLYKMYVKYSESKGWKVDVHDAPAGESIGIDRALFTVHGHNAYGMLRAEQGTHRLVRISPTDVKKRRQTTFTGVSIMPVVPDTIAVDIKDEDVRIDVYRSSGPGGQSVNTTDSAVRLTHVPTGTVVTCQNEKSQHKNKESAFKILRARLYEIEKQRRDTELEQLRGPKQEITWGSQIRSYVLYPYQMVKDLRTGIETGNVDAVLGGALDPFILGFHRWKAAGAVPVSHLDTE